MNRVATLYDRYRIPVAAVAALVTVAWVLLKEFLRRFQICHDAIAPGLTYPVVTLCQPVGFGDLAAPAILLLLLLWPDLAEGSLGFTVGNKVLGKDQLAVSVGSVEAKKTRPLACPRQRPSRQSRRMLGRPPGMPRPRIPRRGMRCVSRTSDVSGTSTRASSALKMALAPTFTGRSRLAAFRRLYGKELEDLEQAVAAINASPEYYDDKYLADALRLAEGLDRAWDTIRVMPTGDPNRYPD